MNNTQKFIITIRFPSWGYGDRADEYPAFGVKYLVEIPIEKLEIDGGLEKYFVEIYDKKIGKGKEFNGEILFVEETDLVILTH